MLAIVAGSDTTSTALSNIIWYLLQNPECYSRLRKEVDALGNDLTNTAKHSRMHYLNAVMQVPPRFHLFLLIDHLFTETKLYVYFLLSLMAAIGRLSMER